MRIALTTNISGKKGLTRDFELLRDFLESLGHRVSGLQYDQPAPDDTKFHLMISLETIARHLLPLAPIHWIFVNHEWVTADSIPIIDKHFAKILTKTREAQRILEPMFPGRVHFTGFICRDQYDPSVPRERKFLHVGGEGAVHRNTAAVVDAWRWKQNGKAIDAELIVVSSVYKGEAPEGVTILPRISEEELKRLQNACLFHLCPSATEGYGHALHEACSVGAAVITTGEPPMNEVNARYFVPSTGKSKFNFATAYEVSAIDIHATCLEALSSKLAGWNTSRAGFLAENKTFCYFFGQHISAIDPHKPMPKWKRSLAGIKSIAFLGNFKHTFCTESDLAWTFEHAGHEIIRMQENEVTMRDLEQAYMADMFLWVRTPGFLGLTDEDMFEFLGKLRNKGVASCSVHLDRFFSIPERECLVGAIPFFKTDFCFTADGGHQDDFKARGVNHIWLPPAIVLRAAYPGTPQSNLACDVGFVGSVEGYHAVYPERQHLVEFLKEQYRCRFRVFSGFREQKLNDLYSSIKVCIGDSIFANQRKSPKYWSDRIPETMGRGGVLIHPEVEGLDMPGLITHRPGDFHDLQKHVEHLLATPLLRRSCRDVGMEFVRKNHTYSNRIEKILKTVFGAPA